MPAKTSRLAIRVHGNQFVDGANEVVQLRGVNRAGTEYRCAFDDDAGFVTDDDGTSGTTLGYASEVIGALQTWNPSGASTNVINAVRIPLNESCWLGINGVSPAYSGARYQSFIAAEVEAATKAGMFTILDLHRSAPGAFLADQQDVGPNADHSVDLWEQVARAYRDQPSVMFDTINEPRLWCYSPTCQGSYEAAAKHAWSCYRDGCTYRYRSDDSVEGRNGRAFRIAGQQDLVDAIRKAGARNVVLVEGLGYANAFDHWTRYRPDDPTGQLAAELHTYPSSGANVNDRAALDGMLGSGDLASSFPLVVGEFAGASCDQVSDGFAQDTMDWADDHGYSYLAWGWDAGEGCNGPSLVTDNDSGAPTEFGDIVRSHLVERAAEH